MKLLLCLSLLLSFAAWSQCPSTRPQAEFEQDLLNQRAAVLAQVRSEGPECARRTAEAYAYHAVTSQTRNCTTNPCSPWNRGQLNDESYRSQREQLASAVRELVFMASLTEELPTELTEQICRELAPENPLALMRKNAVVGLLAEMSCLELPVGQTRIVDGFNGNIAAGYALERTGTNSYRIGLNVNLVSTSLNAESLASFEARMQSCVASWNPVLRGPRGEQLTIDLTNPTRTAAQPPGTPRAPEHTIQVHSSWPRANSHNYPRSMDCATTMHEIMHLMGLCDEYREQDAALGFNCRIVPERVTLMANQNLVASELPQITQCTIRDEFREAWSRYSQAERNVLLMPDLAETLGSDGASYCVVSPEHRVLSISDASADLSALAPRAITLTNDVLVMETGVVVADGDLRVEHRRIDCQCAVAANPNKCRAWITRQRSQFNRPYVRSNCPALMTGTTSYGGDGTDNIAIQPNGITITEAGFRDSALEPAHFQRILAGTCTRQAQDYNVCSSWAYVSTCGAPQSTCFGTPRECEGMPLQCTDERFLGITPTTR